MAVGIVESGECHAPLDVLGRPVKLHACCLEFAARSDDIGHTERGYRPAHLAPADLGREL